MRFLDLLAPCVNVVLYCVVLCCVVACSVVLCCVAIFRIVYSKWSTCAGCYLVADYMWLLLFAQAN